MCSGGLAPSSVPGESLLMWMYQYSQPSLSRMLSMLLPLVRVHETVPSWAATSTWSLWPIRSAPWCERPPARGASHVFA
jgi:hypothetical protein